MALVYARVITDSSARGRRASWRWIYFGRALCGGGRPARGVGPARRRSCSVDKRTRFQPWDGWGSGQHGGKLLLLGSRAGIGRGTPDWALTPDQSSHQHLLHVGLACQWPVGWPPLPVHSRRREESGEITSGAAQRSMVWDWSFDNGVRVRWAPTLDPQRASQLL